jgi:hypothetical protein
MQNPDPAIDRFGIAARLRALLFARDPHATPGTIAQSLGVRESALRLTLDDRSPRPTLEVLIAVIRHHGVDPTWILTGIYDQATHREALEDETSAKRMLVRTTLAREGETGLGVLDVPRPPPPSPGR